MNKKNLKAKDVMAKPLISINTEDTMKRAAAVMLDHRFSGLPVLDLLERPVGVITKTDIARYERERSVAATGDERILERALDTGESITPGKGFQGNEDEDLVSHWMAPNVYAVNTEDPIEEVVDWMIKKRIHRLFVKDVATDELVGVITTFDILKIFGETLRSVKKTTAKKHHASTA